MKRAIKFRAWDKKNKLMSSIYEPFRYYDEGVDIDFVFKDYELPINATDVEVMQYTGLKDKNGKEIYEGDILKYVNGRLSDPIGFPKDYTWLKVRTEDTRFTSAVEVIGNVFENPELLPNK